MYQRSLRRSGAPRLVAFVALAAALNAWPERFSAAYSAGVQWLSSVAGLG